MYVFVCVCICKLVLAYKNMFYYGIYTYICIYKYVYFIFVLIYPPPTLTSPFSLSQSHREKPFRGQAIIANDSSRLLGLPGATGDLSKLQGCLSERELFCVVSGLLLWYLSKGANLYLFLSHPSLSESKVMISTRFYSLWHEGLIH